MSNKRPFFSVIIPTYNREQLVMEAIDSVLNQSDQDFELLVIDNGSTDNTRSTVTLIADPRVHYHYREPSPGPAWPRNLGLEKATGYWVCFLDSDDIWYQNKLSMVRDQIEFDAPDMVVHWQSETDIKNNHIRTLYCDTSTINSYKKMLVTENTIVTSSACIRKSFIENNTIRFKQTAGFMAVEDYDFWLTVLYNGGKVSCVNQILGEMRTPELRSGTMDVFWTNLPNLFYEHAYKVQKFSSFKTLLYKRMLAGLSLRQGFYTLKQKQYSKGLLYILKSITYSPIELFRYSYFRIKQRKKTANA